MDDQFGLGVYTLSDAAHLIHAERRAVKRWLYGYDYPYGPEDARTRRHSEPLWRPQYSRDDFAEDVIGFRDLMELRVVREFVRRGVSLIVVRHCLDAAKDLFGADYPFSKQRFVTDGETIFAEAMRSEATESEMLNLRTRQYTFHSIIKESLYAGIDYEDGFARRWYPEPRNRTIVVDPALQFGHPTVEEVGVRTATLYTSYEAEHRNVDAVARLFEVSTRQVEVAVRFEKKLLKAA